MCSTGEVFDAIQKAKAEASEYSTNFFPNLQKLQEWIAAKEFFGAAVGRTAFFSRPDRGFWHLYFCAPNRQELQGALAAIPKLRTEQFVVDLIGLEPDVKSWLSSWDSVGFRLYQKLFRMTRPGKGTTPTGDMNDQRIDFAGKPDAIRLFDMLCQSFDKYAEQLPTLHEIESATQSRQILAARSGEKLAGLLYFDDHRFSSMIRYWLVGSSFRGRGLGSALMGRYLTHAASVRRFLLWVIADNEHAIAKYRQHGFAPDGLFDYVLANKKICQ